MNNLPDDEYLLLCDPSIFADDAELARKLQQEEEAKALAPVR